MKKKEKFVHLKGVDYLYWAMRNELNTIKSKRLKFIRMLMYLDALLILLSFIMIDIRHFSWYVYSGVCLRILVLVGMFVILFIIEKSLSRYLRKHRNE